MRYVHEHLLLGGGGLHARSRRVGARNSRPVNQLQQNVFSIGQYPHVLVVEAMQQPRQAVEAFVVGGATMPQPSIGFNRWGYVCGAHEQGKRDCNSTVAAMRREGWKQVG